MGKNMFFKNTKFVCVRGGGGGGGGRGDEQVIKGEKSAARIDTRIETSAIRYFLATPPPKGLTDKKPIAVLTANTIQDCLQRDG